MSGTTRQTDPAPVLVHRLIIEDASVRDISQFGLAVETSVPLKIGVRYVFCLISKRTEILLDGEVVRCELAAIQRSGQGGPAIYHSGIAFQIERNPKEMALLDILQENLFGEKRFGSARIQPIRPMLAHIAEADVGRITKLSENDMTLLIDNLPDPDEPWRLLVETGAGHVRVEGRVLLGAKRTDRDLFETQLTFLEPQPETLRFLQSTALLIP